MLMIDVFVNDVQVLLRAHICSVHVSAVPYMPMSLRPFIAVVHPLPYAFPSSSFPQPLHVLPISPSFLQVPSSYAPAHTYLPLDTPIPTLLPVVTLLVLKFSSLRR
ncbi:hypothetical protein K523DRAFT_323220 [Schizophyllum commune Tattone D]|nr:hypothetical protein K523DRAFT_323220 [Schizophyllum commune Tattone D]